VTCFSAGAKDRYSPQSYAKRKSRRGRKKEICTVGFACLIQECDYFAITDEAIHALVGNGKRGINRGIQQFRCQAGKTGFTCRRNTPLYYLKIAPDRIGEWPKSHDIDWEFSNHAVQFRMLASSDLTKSPRSAALLACLGQPTIGTS
jgi:hypothetical protein